MVESSYKEYLTFSIGIDVYAINIEYVFDIIQKSTTVVTQLPMVPNYIKGVINLRGKITPVIDVRLRLGAEEREYDDFNCIIVIQLDEMRVGLIVDSVNETYDIYDDTVVPPPVSSRGFKNKYISGIATTTEGVKLIMDCNALLSADFMYSHVAEIGGE